MPRWDIFCTVIDNYGDIAVTWRLARQLVAEHGINVRLWVDDLHPLAALYPGIDSGALRQTLCGVEVCLWPADFPDVEIADVVIEAFACDIPDNYIAAMAASAVKPRWINLEYLSAEDWVAGCHRLPSPHPRLPLVKHFFFPGFTPDTGGLLREHGLIDRRRAFQASATAQREFWTQLGISPDPAACKISLFGYENPALPALLQAWVDNPTPICCVLPDSRLSPQVSAFFGENKPWQRGNLTMHRLSFLDQDSYDQLLWACDMNFVRGEDSFVRALWAGQPFIWHIYPQADNAHHAKLNAFLALYQRGLNSGSAVQLTSFWHCWNQLPSGTLNWQAWQSTYPQLKYHHEAWVEQLIQQADLAINLVKDQ
ncbi:elongation factor P maturation arginine rhamnosyltransferase EarP [Sulfuriferula thiophila]|uniref:elongation factor P maturation arginine rhamnosyltransferase EarP n=1 Tax=Sulfuriferula thiophila TaxID=1781211 RepID=UPI000F605729|nr:elongation factor P maturation arginine rhamnosyltransferase EarP [Sulfuriferula thiophila]